jgi:hypothetical protein
MKLHYSFTFAFHKGCLKGKANSTIWAHIHCIFTFGRHFGFCLHYPVLTVTRLSQVIVNAIQKQIPTAIWYYVNFCSIYTLYNVQRGEYYFFLTGWYTSVSTYVKVNKCHYGIKKWLKISVCIILLPLPFIKVYKEIQNLLLLRVYFFRQSRTSRTSSIQWSAHELCAGTVGTVFNAHHVFR